MRRPRSIGRVAEWRRQQCSPSVLVSRQLEALEAICLHEPNRTALIRNQTGETELVFADPTTLGFNLLLRARF